MVGRKVEEEAGADVAPGAVDAVTSLQQRLAPWTGTAKGICPCRPFAACESDAAVAAARVLALVLESAKHLRRIERRWLASG